PAPGRARWRARDPPAAGGRLDGHGTSAGDREGRMIRLALVDDHELVRHGIRALLALDPAFTVVAEAADGEQALRCARTGAIDVMLLDLRMPRLGGLEVLRALREEGSPIATIVLTTFHD